MSQTTYPGLDLNVFVENRATHRHTLLPPDLSGPQAQAFFDASGLSRSQPNLTCTFWVRDVPGMEATRASAMIDYRETSCDLPNS
jgi:hypothetical protein